MSLTPRTATLDVEQVRDAARPDVAGPHVAGPYVASTVVTGTGVAGTDDACLQAVPAWTRGDSLEHDRLSLGGAALQRLTPADRLLFERFGVGAAAPAPFERIHDAFVQQAQCFPSSVAVVHGTECITYAELDRRSDELCARLRGHGVAAGDHVGLFLERSIPMVVGILGVLKAAAAYVPQDLRITPAHHLDHIVRTAQVHVVLTLTRFAPKLTAHPDLDVIVLDETYEVNGPAQLDIPQQPTSQKSASPDAAAVVIFTSGTTGRPNGVSVTHANLCNILLSGPGSLGIRPGQKVAQILNIAFDMAVWEILGAVTHGATLVIRGADIEETVRRVDVVIATPSILSSLDATRCCNVKTVAVAGERCPQALADTWSAFTDFHNSCGPTEVTIVNTLDRYDQLDGELTIGQPLPNNTVYILDEQLQPCGIGEVGEMWAGGACVTAGYVGNDVLTAQRYRPDPFLGGAARMFRTRDLGRWTANGQLEHHGRTDDQVKVHGFRVELDAVTSALELAPGCAQATTILYEGDLVGFVSPATVDVAAAREAAGSMLPYYCLPSLVLAVDTLPRTDRGKVDKAALRETLDLEKTAAIEDSASTTTRAELLAAVA